VERTLREIAEDLGLSAERVRQIEQRALETLWAIVTPTPGGSALDGSTSRDSVCQPVGPEHWI
jgi:hypothetical protein